MLSIYRNMIKSGRIETPNFNVSDVVYETHMGSTAYGTSTEASDLDIYAVVVPHPHIVFPHLVGHISGFEDKTVRFENLQAHGIEYGGRQWDVSVYNIVRYFQLCLDNNPNMIDSLYTPEDSITYINSVGRTIRNNRGEFLHKGYARKALGFATSQLKKFDRVTDGKRKHLIEQFGYDVKAASHVVRLLLQAEQVLTQGRINFFQSRDTIRGVKLGQWDKEDVYDFYIRYEDRVMRLVKSSNLREKPDTSKIKRLLFHCLDMHYGNLNDILFGRDAQQTFELSLT